MTGHNKKSNRKSLKKQITGSKKRKFLLPVLLSGCFLLSVLHTESAIEGNTILIGDIDNSNSLAVNFNLLFSVTATLVGSVYHNFVNQVIEYFCSQFFWGGVFTDISEVG